MKKQTKKTILNIFGLVFGVFLIDIGLYLLNPVDVLPVIKDNFWFDLSVWLGAMCLIYHGAIRALTEFLYLIFAMLSYMGYDIVKRKTK